MAKGKGTRRAGRAKGGGEAPGAGGVRVPKWARFGSREEIQRTLAASIVALVRGRITPKQSWAIGRTAEAHLRLLGVREQLEDMMQKEERVFKDRHGKWVN